MRYVLGFLLAFLFSQAVYGQSLPPEAKPLAWYNSLFVELLYKGHYIDFHRDSTTGQLVDSVEYNVSYPFTLTLEPSRKGYFHTISGDSVALGFTYTGDDGRLFDVSFGFHLDSITGSLKQFAFIGNTSLVNDTILSNTSETFYLADTVLSETMPGELSVEVTSPASALSRTDSVYEVEGTVKHHLRLDPTRSTFQYVTIKLYHTEFSGVRSAVQASGVRVLSNPASDRLQLSYTVERPEPVQITLVNQAGQTVREIVTGVQSTGKHTIEEDIRTLPAGMYFLSYHTSAENTMEKVLILR